MNRLPPRIASFDDEALDRALSRAGVPDVPPGLADRIVSTVTAMPQEPVPGRNAAEASPPGPMGRRRALAASFVAIAVLVGGAVGLMSAPRPERDSAAPAPRSLAQARSAAVDPGARAPAAAHGDSRPAPPPAASPSGAARPAAPRDDLERSGDTPAPPDLPGLPPASATDTRDEGAIELAREQEAVSAERPADADPPVGPSLAGDGTPAASTPDGAVYGPPAPQGLGIVDGKPSPAPTARQTGPARPRSPGRPNRR